MRPQAIPTTYARPLGSRLCPVDGSGVPADGSEVTSYAQPHRAYNAGLTRCADPGAALLGGHFRRPRRALAFLLSFVKSPFSTARPPRPHEWAHIAVTLVRLVSHARSQLHALINSPSFRDGRMGVELTRPPIPNFVYTDPRDRSSVNRNADPRRSVLHRRGI